MSDVILYLIFKLCRTCVFITKTVIFPLPGLGKTEMLPDQFSMLAKTSLQ